MKNSVIIKSFPNGIVLNLDSEVPFDILLADIADKFRESSGFFKDAKMALSIRGRVLSEEEERLVVKAIAQNSLLQIVCLVGGEEAVNHEFVKAIRRAERMIEEEKNNEGQFYRGTLKNGQVLETESSIVILGDVNPGSTIISARDIIVLGGLFGKAYAGGNGEEGHYIAALEMSPERLKIGDFKYRTKDKKKWSIKPKVQPKIAYVKDDTVVIDSLTKDILSELPAK
ncbi:MAG: septum site-determining protein MinC [Clostridium sp.]|nr:septum site-determining protein MinC [Clostridium sp.]